MILDDLSMTHYDPSLYDTIYFEGINSLEGTLINTNSLTYHIASCPYIIQRNSTKINIRGKVKSYFSSLFTTFLNLIST
jgi:hypothetical protein